MEEKDKEEKTAKIIRFPRQFRPIAGGAGGAGGKAQQAAPHPNEIRAVMREVESTLRLTHHTIKQLERDMDLLAERTSRHTHYILAIVQTLLKAGLEVKLTSKDPSKEEV
jgi:hypothetical protein